jgi:hypothetical protein
VRVAGTGWSVLGAGTTVSVEAEFLSALRATAYDRNLLERENPVRALLPREGQPFQQLGPQLGVWVLLGWRDDDVLHLCGVSLVQLR